MIYSTAILVPSAFLYTVKAFSLAHRKCYNIVFGKKDKYIFYVLQQVRRDFLLRVYKCVVS